MALVTRENWEVLQFLQNSYIILKNTSAVRVHSQKIFEIGNVEIRFVKQPENGPLHFLKDAREILK